MRESNIIDSFIMTGISKLRNEGGWIYPINVGLWCSTEEMSIVSSERNRGDITHNLTLVDDLHSLDWDSCQFSLSSSDNKITVRKNSNGWDSQTEKTLHWTNSLVDSFFDVNLKDISSFCSTIYIRIVVVDSSVGKLTLYITEICIERLNFLVDLVNGKNLNTILLYSDKTIAIIIEEKNLIDYFFIWSSIETFSTLNVPNDEHISTWIQKYLSSRHPCEARRRESGENARLVTEFLCSLNLCLIYLFSKSQSKTSATWPGKECSALARYLPSLEILIAVYFVSYMRCYDYVPWGRFVSVRGYA